MIPMPNLDDEFFSSITENAKNMIPQVAPQWTDYNKHDSGITFIELFAWFKEMQQYYINQLSDSMQEKYLTLLGVERHSQETASVIVQGETLTHEDFSIPSLTRVFADDVCFETQSVENVLDNQIKGVVLDGKEFKSFSSEMDKLIQDNMLHILPFGDTCNVGDEFRIIFSKALPIGVHFNVYFSIYDDYPVRRNPITAPKDFIPLSKVEVRCLTVQGWKRLEVVADQTFGFIQSGNVTLKIPEGTPPLKSTSNGYQLSFCLLDSYYEVPPAITGIKLNTINVVQKETFAKCYDFPKEDVVGYELKLPSSRLLLFGRIDVYFRFGDCYIKQDNFIVERYNDDRNVKLVFNRILKKIFDSVRVVAYSNGFYDSRVLAVGNNFPYQTVNLDSQSLIREDLKIMCLDTLNGGFHNWQRKDNFDTSKSSSRDYIFDEISGIIRFGDGERGLSPNGDIVIVGYSETMAEHGNIKANMVNRSDYDSLRVRNITNAEGGKPLETIDESFKRFLKSTETPQRVVTFRDYEECVMNTQGLMVNQCKAVAMQPVDSTNGVTLIVQPYSNDRMAKLNTAYVKNVLQCVESKRLIGTNVNVISPQYVGVDVYIEVSVKSHYSNAYETVQGAIERMFSENHFPLGGVISYSDVYCLVDTLECVNYVKKLNITAQGSSHTISNNGDIHLAYNGIAYLNRAICTINNSI